MTLPLVRAPVGSYRILMIRRWPGCVGIAILCWASAACGTGNSTPLGSPSSTNVTLLSSQEAGQQWTAFACNYDAAVSATLKIFNAFPDKSTLPQVKTAAAALSTQLAGHLDRIQSAIKTFPQAAQGPIQQYVNNARVQVRDLDNVAAATSSSQALAAIETYSAQADAQPVKQLRAALGLPPAAAQNITNCPPSSL